MYGDLNLKANIANGNFGNGDLDVPGDLDVGGEVNVVGDATFGTLNTLQINFCTVGTFCSDRRIKENIKPLSGSLAKILKLEGVSFNWNDEKLGKNQAHGLIAQDVREVIPEIVQEKPKKPEEKYST